MLKLRKHNVYLLMRYIVSLQSIKLKTVNFMHGLYYLHLALVISLVQVMHSSVTSG